MSTPAALFTLLLLPLSFASVNSLARALWNAITTPPAIRAEKPQTLTGPQVLWRVARVPLILFAAFFAIAFIHEQSTAVPEPQRFVVNNIGDHP